MLNQLLLGMTINPEAGAFDGAARGRSDSSIKAFI